MEIYGKKKLKYILYLAALFIIVFGLYFYNSPAFATRYIIEVVNSESTDEILYMKSISRGLSYEVIVINTDKRPEAMDVERDLLNTTGEPFFYKYQSDTLFLYGGVWKNNERNCLKTTIIIEDLENMDFIKLKKTYKEKGLKVFPSSYEEFLD